MPTFTIRRWLAVVAAFGVLGRTGIVMLALVLASSIFWIPPVRLAAWFGAHLRYGWIHAAILMILFVLTLLVGSGPFPPADRVAFLVGVGLRIANGLGPFHAADRRRQGLPLYSGHWAWAWAGLIWLFQAHLFLPGATRHLRDVEIMAAAARALLAGVIVALAFGRRPAGRDWGDFAGWLVVECDIIAWFWHEAR